MLRAPVVDPASMDDTDYERARAARIAANAARLAALGLSDLVEAAKPKVAAGPAAPRPPRRPRPPSSPPVARSGLRPRPPRPSPPPPAGDPSSSSYRPRRSHAHRSLYYPVGDGADLPVLAAPFVTGDSAFTIHCLGTLVGDDGENETAPLFWSSAGSRFHHPYPVGYAATRHGALCTRHDFRCTISAGPTGPVFTVTDLATGRSFEGPSPTRPWTRHCMETGTGVRVSGPLFFGFCDPHVQAALRAMVAGGAAGGVADAKQASPGAAAAAAPPGRATERAAAA